MGKERRTLKATLDSIEVQIESVEMDLSDVDSEAVRAELMYIKAVLNNALYSLEQYAVHLREGPAKTASM